MVGIDGFATRVERGGVEPYEDLLGFDVIPFEKDSVADGTCSMLTIRRLRDTLLDATIVTFP